MANIDDILIAEEIKEIKPYFKQTKKVLTEEDYFYAAVMSANVEIVNKLAKHINIPLPENFNNLISHEQTDKRLSLMQRWVKLVKSIDAMENYGQKLIDENKGGGELIAAADHFLKEINIKASQDGLYTSPINWDDRRTDYEEDLSAAHSMMAKGLARNCADAKGKSVVNLAKQLKSQLVNLEIDTKNSPNNRAFYSLLHSKDKELAEHREFSNVILANISLCLAGLGIFYLAAGCVNLWRTSGQHFFFFTETQSQRKQQEIQRCAVRLGTT